MAKNKQEKATVAEGEKKHVNPRQGQDKKRRLRIKNKSQLERIDRLD
jgi:hypothetical protein